MSLQLLIVLVTTLTFLIVSRSDAASQPRATGGNYEDLRSYPRRPFNQFYRRPVNQDVYYVEEKLDRSIKIGRSIENSGEDLNAILADIAHDLELLEDNIGAFEGVAKASNLKLSTALTDLTKQCNGPIEFQALRNLQVRYATELEKLRGVLINIYYIGTEPTLQKGRETTVAISELVNRYIVLQNNAKGIRGQILGVDATFKIYEEETVITTQFSMIFKSEGYIDWVISRIRIEVLPVVSEVSALPDYLLTPIELDAALAKDKSLGVLFLVKEALDLAGTWSVDARIAVQDGRIIPREFPTRIMAIPAIMQTNLTIAENEKLILIDDIDTIYINRLQVNAISLLLNSLFATDPLFKDVAKGLVFPTFGSPIVATGFEDASDPMRAKLTIITAYARAFVTLQSTECEPCNINSISKIVNEAVESIRLINIAVTEEAVLCNPNDVISYPQSESDEQVELYYLTIMIRFRQEILIRYIQSFDDSPTHFDRIQEYPAAESPCRFQVVSDEEGEPKRLRIQEVEKPKSRNENRSPSEMEYASIIELLRNHLNGNLNK